MIARVHPTPTPEQTYAGPDTFDKPAKELPLVAPNPNNRLRKFAERHIETGSSKATEPLTHPRRYYRQSIYENTNHQQKGKCVTAGQQAKAPIRKADVKTETFH